MMHKQIPDYEGFYDIYEDGRIYSHNSNKFMKLTKTVDGYYSISLSKTGKKKQHKHHRLMMITFKPIKDPDRFVVNHINGNKLDNSLSNLEWCTVEENNNHAIENKLNRGKNKLSDEQVVEIKKHIKSLQPNTIRYISLQIAPLYNISPRTVESIIINRRWNHIHI